MTIYVRSGGAWRTITATNPGSLSVRSGGAWRTITESYIRESSTWRFVYGLDYELWAWGRNNNGDLGINNGNRTYYSSPIQIPGVTWNFINVGERDTVLATKTDGTLWSWGYNEFGQLGQSNTIRYSSPVQIPGTTWRSISAGRDHSIATKTDGTLWVWGSAAGGALGLNSNNPQYSSPVQVPGTIWSSVISAGRASTYAIRTDGTLWAWGRNDYGQLGFNTTIDRSSPVQIPGTAWRSVDSGYYFAIATKTDNTLWAWGSGNYNTFNVGALGLNSLVSRSSPTQVPGTTWKSANCTYYHTIGAKTDGTLWAWGRNDYGQIGQNNTTQYSSPVQIPGTTWSSASSGTICQHTSAIKTDGTLWAWGLNNRGQLGQSDNNIHRSSPVQIPGTTWTFSFLGEVNTYATKNNTQ